MRCLADLGSDEKLQRFKADLPKNKQRTKRRQSDWAYFMNNAKYIDLVWRNKNDIKAFIVLNHESMIEMKSTSLFDIKTVASSYGLYKHFDWNEFERRSLLVSNMIEQDPVPKDFADDLHLLLDEAALISESVCQGLPDDIFIPVPKLVYWSLSQQLSVGNVRIFPIRLRYKQAICVKDLHDFVNQQKYIVRLDKIMGHYDFEAGFHR